MCFCKWFQNFLIQFDNSTRISGIWPTDRNWNGCSLRSWWLVESVQRSCVIRRVENHDNKAWSRELRNNLERKVCHYPFWYKGLCMRCSSCSRQLGNNQRSRCIRVYCSRCTHKYVASSPVFRIWERCSELKFDFRCSKQWTDAILIMLRYDELVNFCVVMNLKNWQLKNWKMTLKKRKKNWNLFMSWTLFGSHVRPSRTCRKNYLWLKNVMAAQTVTTQTNLVSLLFLINDAINRLHFVLRLTVKNGIRRTRGAHTYGISPAFQL